MTVMVVVVQNLHILYTSNISQRHTLPFTRRQALKCRSQHWTGMQSLDWEGSYASLTSLPLSLSDLSSVHIYFLFFVDAFMRVYSCIIIKLPLFFCFRSLTLFRIFSLRPSFSFLNLRLIHYFQAYIIILSLSICVCVSLLSLFVLSAFLSFTPFHLFSYFSTIYRKRNG